MNNSARLDPLAQKGMNISYTTGGIQTPKLNEEFATAPTLNPPNQKKINNFVKGTKPAMMKIEIIKMLKEAANVLEVSNTFSKDGLKDIRKNVMEAKKLMTKLINLMFTPTGRKKKQKGVNIGSPVPNQVIRYNVKPPNKGGNARPSLNANGNRIPNNRDPFVNVKPMNGKNNRQQKLNGVRPPSLNANGNGIPNNSDPFVNANRTVNVNPMNGVNNRQQRGSKSQERSLFRKLTNRVRYGVPMSS